MNTDTITALAALIREVDGGHDLGAGALAEALVERGVGIESQIRRQISDEWAAKMREDGVVIGGDAEPAERAGLPFAVWSRALWHHGDPE